MLRALAPQAIIGDQTRPAKAQNCDGACHRAAQVVNHCEDAKQQSLPFAPCVITDPATCSDPPKTVARVAKTPNHHVDHKELDVLDDE
eukprot:CAMPEP_0115328436 /NCGR_PEP_ID=MMETSP0270-20121206/84680_1 /TAXON_ID=71861 /ORGANISM="Scrippsiella trochoidea, Strain CCMP3099" /LENGTH=87 /DNA_ID=CAMNT_0002748959 /DNA_START=308 /DNA_END=571 /DNA_ORIENTATION=-